MFRGHRRRKLCLSAELMHVVYNITLVIQEMLRTMVLIFAERGGSTFNNMGNFKNCGINLC